MTTLLQREAPIVFRVLPLMAVLVAGSACERKQSEDIFIPPTKKEERTNGSENPRAGYPAVIQVPSGLLRLCDEDPEMAAQEALALEDGTRTYNQLLRHLFHQDPTLRSTSLSRTSKTS